MALSKRKPSTQEIDGEKCSIYYDPTSYRAIPEFKPQTGDIIQVSYPRSGSHLIQQILQLILNSGESAKTYPEFLNRARFLERFVPPSEEVASPRLLGTHAPLGRVRVSQEAKYVYVARNPWDCCVSCFHVTREAPEFENGTFEDFLDAFLDGQWGFGDYFDHVLSGYRRRGEPNVFFVTYEDLQRDKAGVLKRLAYFLGLNYGRMLENDHVFFQKIMEKSTIEYMKRFMNVNSSDLLELMRGDLDLASEQRGKGEQRIVNIIRNGRTRESKKYFTKDSIKKMKTKIDEKTKGSDIMSLWTSDEPL